MSKHVIVFGTASEQALVRTIEELRRENAALRRDVYQCPPTSENDYEGFKWSDACEELEREVTALRKMILNAEVLAEHDPAHGPNDWWSGGCWLRSGQQIMIVDRVAFYAARKEAP